MITLAELERIEDELFNAREKWSLAIVTRAVAEIEIDAKRRSDVAAALINGEITGKNDTERKIQIDAVSYSPAITAGLVAVANLEVAERRAQNAAKRLEGKLLNLRLAAEKIGMVEDK